MTDVIPFLDLRPHDPASFHIRPLRTFIAREDDAHRHNFQEILWVKSGDGTHQIDNEVLSINPHTFYLIAKGQVHQFLGGANLQGLLIRFTDEFLLELPSQTSWNYRWTLFNQVEQQNRLVVEEADVAEFESLFGLILQEQQRKDVFGQSDSLRHFLLILLMRLERLRRASLSRPGTSPITQQQTICHDFLQLLETNYKHTHLVADYADELGVSPRQLSRVLHKHLGRSGKQLIDERLILDAKRYLRYTPYSIKEISYHLGYKDPSYFSRIFKQNTGLTPKEYKTKLPE